MKRLLRLRDGVLEKTCTKCGEWLPANEDFFYKSATASGFASSCKECEQTAERRRYRAKNGLPLAEYEGGSSELAAVRKTLIRMHAKRQITAKECDRMLVKFNAVDDFLRAKA